jgi:hypothetical protein
MHWIDPECLQETRGTVTQFLLNPHVSGGANPTLHGGARLSRGVNNRVDRWRRLLSAPIVSQNGSASMSRG